MEGTPLLLKCYRLGAIVSLTVVYCVAVVRHRRPGWPRLMSSLPALVVFGLSPLYVKESMVLSGCLGLTLMWVSSFKLLAYSGNRGALAHPGVISGLQWGTLLLFPFFPTKTGRQPCRTSGRRALLGVLLRLGVWLGLNVLLLSSEQLPRGVKHTCYAVYMWMFVSLCLDAASPLSGRLLAGVPLQPAMEAPYSATSVREFWGRRYNQIVSATLLETVYKPIVQRRWVAATAPPSPPAAAAAADASDAVAAAPGRDVVPQAAAGGVGIGVQQRRVVYEPMSVTSSSASLSESKSSSSGNLLVRAGPPQATVVVTAEAAAGSGNRASSGADLSNSGGATAAAGMMQAAAAGNGVARPAGRRASRALVLGALMASFLVSGIMHEICIAFMCGGRLEGSFRMLGFFLLQPPLIAAQDAATAALLPARLRASWGGRMAQRAATLAAVLGSAELFWGALESCRIDERGLQEVVGALQGMAEWLRASGVLGL